MECNGSLQHLETLCCPYFVICLVLPLPITTKIQPFQPLAVGRRKTVFFSVMVLPLRETLLCLLSEAAETLRTESLG